MRMTASTRLVGGVTIVDLSGRIVLGEGSAGLRDLVRDLAREGIKKILLNLRNVDYIDSAGLGELVSAFTSMRNQVGELKLLNLTKRVRSLLQITKLVKPSPISPPPSSLSLITTPSMVWTCLRRFGP